MKTTFPTVYLVCDSMELKGKIQCTAPLNRLEFHREEQALCQEFNILLQKQVYPQ